jgi:hypothetical protein
MGFLYERKILISLFLWKELDGGRQWLISFLDLI